jgi:hypothetical protein
MTWLLVGYLSKRRATRTGWVSPWPAYPDVGFPCSEPVEEICSVSDCIARGLDVRDDPAHANPLGLYHDPGSARGVVPAAARADYALYAYRLWPVQFENGQEEPIEVWWDPPAGGMPDTFVRLGWDAVVGGNGHSFGCSPLSCNSGADIVRCPELNRYCLVADEQAAIDLARSFSITQPEPGPYCVVEVWRDAGPTADPLREGPGDG